MKRKKSAARVTPPAVATSAGTAVSPSMAGRRLSLEQMPLVCALACAVVAAVLSLYFQNHVLGGETHGLDAASYRFQARVFAAGRFTAPAVEFDHEFRNPLVVQKDDRRFSIYPPGWPMVQALFIRTGSPALAGAVLAALFVLLVYALSRIVWPADRLTAALAPVVCVACPFITFMSASGLSHLPCATWLLAAAVAAAMGARASRPGAAAGWGIAAGVAAGLALVTRPYSAALACLGSGVVLLVCQRAHVRRWVLVLAAGLPVVLAAGAFLLYYNFRTTGSPWVSGYHVYSSTFGFLSKDGSPDASAWANLRANLPKYWRASNSEMWMGALPDLSLAGAALFFNIRDVRVWALAGAFTIFLLGYGMYWYFDLYFGPRNLFEGMPFLVILSAAGVAVLAGLAASRQLNPGQRVAIYGVLLIHFGWSAFVSYPAISRYYAANYVGDSALPAQAIRAQHLDNAVVLVKGEECVNLQDMNEVDIAHSPIVVAMATGVHSVRKLLLTYPRRQVWLLKFNTNAFPPERNTYSDRRVIKDVQMKQIDPANMEYEVFGN
jgi:4-amino-4-deoxy-L-arabinose transferase-like glycosyltransferase